MDTEIITEKTQSYGYYHISKKKTNLQNLHNFDTEMCYLHKILSKSVKQSSTIIFDEKIICNVMVFFFLVFPRKYTNLFLFVEKNVNRVAG